MILKVFMILFGIFLFLVAILAFLYGLWGLFSATTNPNLARIDPTISVGWLLVTIITGSVGYIFIREGKKE
jgi:hypothetical protein